MAKFAYKATNKDGKDQFGVIESESQALAVQDIRSMGLFPTHIREARKSDEKRARKKKKGLDELYFGGLKWKETIGIGYLLNLFYFQIYSILDMRKIRLSSY